MYCSAWHNCSTHVQREGCTFYDLFTDVLKYPFWSQFRTNDVTQQRYTEAVDSLKHLCTNIEPGYCTVSNTTSDVTSPVLVVARPVSREMSTYIEVVVIVIDRLLDIFSYRHMQSLDLCCVFQMWTFIVRVISHLYSPLYDADVPTANII